MRFISVLMLLTVFCVYGQNNIIKNPSFEEVDKNGHPLAWKEVKPVYQILDGAGRNESRGLAFDNSNPVFYTFPSQKINVKPGEQYKFSVWVKTSGLKGDDNGATICVEWNDKNGRYIDGSYPYGIKGDHDWYKIEGCANVPTEAASVSISPYVRKGLTGKAWFDDLSVMCYMPPIVGVLCGSGYRGISAGEAVKYFAELHLAESGSAPDKVNGLFSVKDKYGKSVFGSPADFVEDNRAGIEIDTSKIPAGDYTVEFTLKSKEGRDLGVSSCSLKCVEKFPDYKVYIDSQRRTIVDGKPFFPLGMYWHDIERDKLETYVKGPFNCLMPYGTQSREQVDLVHSMGLKIIYSVKSIYCGTQWSQKNIKTEEDEINFIKARVKQFKDHPALLAWYINDELPLSLIDRLSARRDLMEELDPDHPAWVVLYQYNQVRSYIPSFDIIGTDPYPIPHKPAGMALEWTRITRDQIYNMRPMWQVPQVFDWGGYKKGDAREESRAPTLDEMRSMAWQCIAAGANGLVFYSYFDLYEMSERDSFAKRWSDVCLMAKEIKRYIPVLLSVDPVKGVSCIKPASVEMRTWSYKGEIYTLLVNGGVKKARVRMRVDYPVKSVVTEFGDKPELMERGGLSLELNPLKPVLIRFEKGGARGGTRTLTRYTRSGF